MQRSFTEMNPVVIGVVGTVCTLALLVVSLNLTNLPFTGEGHVYRAQFAEVGNLNPGDSVEVAGLQVGTINDIRLRDGLAEVEFEVSDRAVHLGEETRIQVSTLTLLGKRGLRLTSAGPGTLDPGRVVPVARTEGPYDLTEALSGLTQTTGAIDTAQVAKALETLTETFGGTAPALQSAVQGLSDISAQVADRDDSVKALLGSAETVTSVLADRNEQIRLLLKDGSTLLGELNTRRAAVIRLLDATQEVSRQLTGLVGDNSKAIGPALDKLNDVTALLNRNKANLENILARAGVYATGLGESLGSGPFFSAYVQNLVPPTSLLPVLGGLSQ
ncbi:MCE family protein [Aeromicrobium sp. NPDC092404]|uniref:MCE family protein n=1 Tax=Aeromicrobium sp. NPDC092404 TaxID=3154976 RepID=UPI003436ED93